MDTKKEKRHPTDNTKATLTHPPPFISCGTQEKKLLRTLSELQEGERLNRKDYARRHAIGRTTVYEWLKTLELKGYVQFINIGNPRITEHGQNYIKSLNKGVASARRGCRGDTPLSTHYVRFSAKIKNNKLLTANDIRHLNPTQHKTQALMGNNRIDHLYYDEGTITISAHNVQIRVFEAVSDDIDENILAVTDKAMRLAELLMQVGFEIDTLKLEEHPHHARVNSALALVMQKVANGKKFEVDIGNGQKFWIDCSTGEPEHETDSEQIMRRMDQIVKSTESTVSDFATVDKLVIISRNLLAMEAMKATPAPQQPMKIQGVDYFG